MWILRILAKVCNRLHLPKGWLRMIFGPLYSLVVAVTDKEVCLADGQDEDLAPLLKLLPSPRRPYGNSLCNNEITDECDLQIIIPVYKVEEYIEACMESVVGQKTKYKFLVVVVNDGSPDKSREILRKYESLDNVVIIDQKNRGLSGARNTGLEKIRAKYVTFVDSDDELLPGAVEAWLDAAYKYDADIVEGGYDIFSHHFSRPGMRHEEEVSDHWLGLLVGFAWGKAYRSTLFRHLHFPEGYWFEDTLMCFVLYPLAKRIATIPQSVYRYRSNPFGISNTMGGNPKCIDSILITMQLLEDALKLNLPVDIQRYEMFLYQTVMNFQRISTLHDEKVNRHLFAIHCRLRNQYFGEWRTSGGLKNIEKDLQEHNYGRFRVDAVCF